MKRAGGAVDEQGGDTELQECLCQVWDVTCVTEVRGMLLEHGVVELMAACVARHSGPQGDRTSEIVAGILGNLASDSAVARALSSNQPALVLFFLLLHVSDAPTLVELGRLFQGMLAHAHRDALVLQGLRTHIEAPAFLERVLQLICLDETQVCVVWLPVLTHMLHLRIWSPAQAVDLVLASLSCEVVRLGRIQAEAAWYPSTTSSSDTAGGCTEGNVGETAAQQEQQQEQQRSRRQDSHHEPSASATRGGCGEQRQAPRDQKQQMGQRELDLELEPSALVMECVHVLEHVQMVAQDSGGDSEVTSGDDGHGDSGTWSQLKQVS